MEIQTRFTQMMGCRLPIVVAPMFLVSNPEMVIAGCQAGAVGTFPALNIRPVEKLREWLQEIRSKTNNTYGVNIIVHRSNIHARRQMEICLEEKVGFFIASLGSPKELVQEAHKIGSKVFCDIISEEHAKKAVAAGADGLIAVCAGAGGHSGNISPLVFIPRLRKQFSLPILASGGIADGRTLAASLLLGADGVLMGTRFIASKECPVSQEYKDAIVQAKAEDIVTTYKIDGIAANVINTPYVQKTGTQLNFLEKFLFRHPKLRNWVTMKRIMSSLSILTTSIERPTWKQLWGAGQSVALVDDVQSIPEILNKIYQEYTQAFK